MLLKFTKDLIRETAKHFLIYFLILIILILAIVFNFYIEKQKHLDITELEEIVEKELQEKHGN